MKQSLVALLALLISVAAQPCYAESNADQQEKDFEQKQRIYGTKHPWENTAPYGTQYTPPQAGAGSSSDDDTDKQAQPAPKSTPKTTVKKSAKKSSKTAHKKNTKKKAAKSAH